MTVHVLWSNENSWGDWCTVYSSTAIDTDSTLAGRLNGHVALRLILICLSR